LVDAFFAEGVPLEGVDEGGVLSPSDGPVVAACGAPCPELPSFADESDMSPPESATVPALATAEVVGHDVAVAVRVLVVDNYDSFVFNLVQYLAQLGADCEVVRNDDIAPGSARDFDGVLLSPGPGAPADAGVCLDLIREVAGEVPILGVCLGHQAIAEAFGGTVGRAPELLHGKTSLVYHEGEGVLAGLPRPFLATRYHSLAVDDADLPELLDVTARTDSGVIMALRHRTLPVEGVQFHPESVLTQGGHRLLANWLDTCGDPAAIARSDGLSPVVPR
jgi:para-aminobenzoate synthetase component 2